MNNLENNSLIVPSRHLLGYGDKNDFITPTNWAVSATRKQDSANPLEIFLTIHGMDKEGKDLLYCSGLEVDSYLTKNNISGSKITAPVKMENYSETLIKEVNKVKKYFDKCVFKTQWIDDTIGNNLLEIIQQDFKHGVSYSFTNNTINQISIYLGSDKQAQNSANWVESVLERGNVKLIDTGWLGINFARPKSLVPDTKEKEESGSCLVS
jgi:hypothetical protein